MAEYKEEVITGSKRTRAYRMIGDNPLDAYPSVTFLEEDVTTINGVTTKVNSGKFTREMTDPATEFPIIDPQTNLETGMVATFGQFYVLGYSLYLYLAQLRDQEIANPMQE